MTIHYAKLGDGAQLGTSSMTGDGIQLGDTQEVSQAIQQLSAAVQQLLIPQGHAGGYPIILVIQGGDQTNIAGGNDTKDDDRSKDITFVITRGNFPGSVFAWHWVSKSGDVFRAVAPPKDPKKADIPEVEVAELKQALMMGSYEVSSDARLKPKTEYKLVLTLLLKDNATGWENPVSIEIQVPGESQWQKQDVILKDLPRRKWQEVVVGNFTIPPPPKTSSVRFKMTSDKTKKKTGLVVKNFLIRPVQK